MGLCIINKQGRTKKWTHEFEMKQDSPCHMEMEQHYEAYNGHFCVRSVLMGLSKHSWGASSGEEAKLEKRNSIVGKSQEANLLLLQ